MPAPRRIGIELLAIAQGAPLTLDLKLESVSEGVLVTGTVSAPTAGECARCLTPITGDVDVDITELFAYPDSETEATTEEDEVGHVVTDRDGDSIDVEQTIVDAVGLVATAGADHNHDVIDPRWAKLSTLLPLDQTSDGAGDS